MGCFFVQVTGGRLELADMAMQTGLVEKKLLVLQLGLAALIASSVIFKTVPLLNAILGCFFFAPIAATYSQFTAGSKVLAASQMLYVAIFPLAGARLITRWQGEILNFIGWFVLVHAVV